MLERRGYRVRHVMNITDVGHMTQDHLADATGEDKLAKAARELGQDPYEVAAHFERAFIEDARTLKLKNQLGSEGDDRTLHPRATDYVPEMLAMIQTLIERGYAYVDGAGQVYFEVAKFPEYGALSGKDIDDLEVGARVAVREEKKDPRDFALWKVDDKHLMQWNPHGPDGWRGDGWARLKDLCPKGVDPRVRPGFPGWHIECSAMARALLGEEIDIHTGGEDNIFPHHECEIAQSYGAGGPNAPKAFAKFWVHCRHLLVNNHKMSKRDGTFFTVRDLLDPKGSGRAELGARFEELGFAGGRIPPSVIRYALVSNPFTQPMNFTFDLLTQAKSSIERIQSRYDRLREQAGNGPVDDRVRALLDTANADFDAALDDNLNTPNAMAAVFNLVSGLNQMTLSPGDAQAALAVFDGFDDILDVLDRRARSGVLSREDLASWLKPETRTARASQWSSWAASPDRAAALASLQAGALPSREELAVIIALDADVIELMVAARNAAKQGRDFATSDAIRDDLKRRGAVVEDVAQGVRWKLP
ncbi:MAG: hypothetical protein QM820_38180 [Minicystis sp.]